MPRKARQQQQHNRKAKQHNTTCPKQSFFNEKLAASDSNPWPSALQAMLLPHVYCTYTYMQCMHRVMHILWSNAYVNHCIQGLTNLVWLEATNFSRECVMATQNSNLRERETAHGQAYVHIILVYSYMHTCPCIHVHTCELRVRTFQRLIKIYM